MRPGWRPFYASTDFEPRVIGGDHPDACGIGAGARPTTAQCVFGRQRLETSPGENGEGGMTCNRPSISWLLEVDLPGP